MDDLRAFEQTCHLWGRQAGGLMRVAQKLLKVVEHRHDLPSSYAPKLTVATLTLEPVNPNPHPYPNPLTL